MENIQKLIDNKKGAAVALAADMGSKANNLAIEVNKRIIESLPLPQESKEHLLKAGEELNEAAKMLFFRALNAPEAKVENVEKKDKLKNIEVKAGKKKAARKKSKDEVKTSDNEKKEGEVQLTINPQKDSIIDMRKKTEDILAELKQKKKG